MDSYFKSLKNIKGIISHMGICQIAGAIFLSVFMAVVSLFITPNGYLEIGEDKYMVFKWICLVGIPVWIIIYVFDFVKKRKWTDIETTMEIGGMTKLFISLYAIVAIISTLTSSFRYQSLFGNAGWHMGLLTQLAMVMIYIIAEDLIRNTEKEFHILFVSFLLLIAAIVLLLGVMNRYSIFFYRIKGHEEDFISTIGNINWFCGYMEIWMGLGVGWFLQSKEKYNTFIAAIFIWICGMATVSCGSSSAYLAWAAISGVSFIMCLSNLDMMRKWAMMEMLMIVSLPCIRIIGLIRPNRMWYASSWLYGVTYENKWIIPFVLLSISAILISFFSKMLVNNGRTLRAACIGAAIAITVAVITLLVLNTVIHGGIWPVRGIDIFTFNRDWGNSRGAIWMASVKCLESMDPFYLFFGIGCDCFSSYAYSVDKIAFFIRNRFGDLLLANAHNEILTMLINEGIIGTVAYIGLWVSHLVSGKEYWKKNPLIMGVMMTIVGYITISMVGFMQILSTPFLFMLMGMMAGLTNQAALNRINISENKEVIINGR